MSEEGCLSLTSEDFLVPDQVNEYSILGNFGHIPADLSDESIIQHLYQRIGEVDFFRNSAGHSKNYAANRTLYLFSFFPRAEKDDSRLATGELVVNVNYFSDCALEFIVNQWQVDDQKPCSSTYYGFGNNVFSYRRKTYKTNVERLNFEEIEICHDEHIIRSVWFCNVIQRFG